MTALYGLRSYGLLAHPLVEALLRREPDVKRECESFAMGLRASANVAVVGPPSNEDARRYCERKNEATPIPAVVLCLSVTRHGASAAPAIKVDCSDRDLAELDRWQRLHNDALARQALGGAIIRARDARAFRLGEVPR